MILRGSEKLHDLSISFLRVVYRCADSNTAFRRGEEPIDRSAKENQKNECETLQTIAS